MNEFFSALVIELNRIGISNVEYFPYSSYIHVAKCCFSAEHTRRGHPAIKFEGERFKAPYTAATARKAAGLIVTALPEKMAERDKREAEQKLNDEARAINRSLTHNKSISVYRCSRGFTMEFTHVDKLTIMAAVDCLQDGGFCDSNPPNGNEDDFMESQEQRTVNEIHRLMKSLPEDRRNSYIKQLYSETLTGKDNY